MSHSYETVCYILGQMTIIQICPSQQQTEVWGLSLWSCCASLITSCPPFAVCTIAMEQVKSYARTHLIILTHQTVFSLLKGDRLLHVSHRWLRGGRCHDARQRSPLHQPLLRAQLLLSGHHCGRPEAHRHLCLSAHLLRRGAHLRLQVPYWGRQQQAALQLRCEEVSQVPQLICKHFKECHNALRTLALFSGSGPRRITAANRARALSVFLLLVLAEHSGDGGRGSFCMYRKTILEEGPFVEIPTYCASFCLIYIWHG